jgi:hypothetical protein
MLADLKQTSGLLDLFSNEELDVLLAEDETRPRSEHLSSEIDETLAAFNVALAIGAQLHEPSSNRALSAWHFRQGREVAFKTMLGGQSLSMIRLFTLLAFYMIGACQRDTASMYLGVAAKAAAVLSLHRASSYVGLRDSETLLR